MNKAVFVKRMDGWTGDARLYRLAPPLEYGDYDFDANKDVTKQTQYVIVSGTYAPFSGVETYIFPANKDDVTDWCELEGSFRGSINHDEALRRAGYEEVVNETDD